MKNTRREKKNKFSIESDQKDLIPFPWADTYSLGISGSNPVPNLMTKARPPSLTTTHFPKSPASTSLSLVQYALLSNRSSLTLHL